MAIQKAEVVVIKRIPLRETSLLVTAFSREFGKIKLTAKGVRKEKSPTLAYLEPFNHISVVYYEKIRSDIHLLTQVSVHNPYSYLRENLKFYSFASYFLELIDTLSEVQDPHPDVFDLLISAFSEFPNTETSHIARIFEIKLFKAIGWLPELTQCAACGNKNLNPAYFSSRHGGIICVNCDKDEVRTIPISEETIDTILYLIHEPFHDAIKFKLSVQAEHDLARISERFLQYRLEYPLSSPHFLQEMKPLF